MRTQEKFDNAWKGLVRFVNQYREPIWLIPSDDKDDYLLSVLKPVQGQVAKGTQAIFYNQHLEAVDSIEGFPL